MAQNRENPNDLESDQGTSCEAISCPFCRELVELQELKWTPQVYCEHCETLFSREQVDIGSIERHFRICKGCGMYSRPRQFTVFYFYFLIFTYGFHHDIVIRCATCIRRSAWSMVFGNLPGLLALPFALVQLKKAYSTKSIGGIFEGLDDANALAKRKKVELALDKYDELMDRVPVNAGVKFNIAKGLMQKNEYTHAKQMLELSLEDCSNYWPAIVAMVDCLERLGDEQELAATRNFWQIGE